jgi:cellulose synthase (UDP-forming)
MTSGERRGLPTIPVLETHRSRFWWRHERLVHVLAVLTLAWGAAYLTWRFIATGSGTPPVLFALLFAAEAFGWIGLGAYAWLAWRVAPTTRPPLPECLPSVDVYVCTYDEAISVLEPTLVGCAAVTVPHRTYVLDDGRRPEIAELASRYGAQYVTRPDNAHAKAGNINHALAVTSGELILCLDADHVPRPDILDAMLGYFEDRKLALVQSPHDFLNRDSAQHTTPGRHEQTLFYEVIAPGKDRHNAMFWCGSATLLRRAALESVGGVLTDTVAEDFHTTIAMHARGWRSRYHNEVLVQGLAPHDLAGFLLQRARWARGNLAVFRTRENPITCRGLSFRQRLSYLTSLANYFNGLQRLVLLFVLTWMLATGQLPMHASITTLVAVWLPWSVLAFVTTSALARGALGPLDSTRYGLMTMGIQIRGVLSLLRPRGAAFKVTPKEGIDEGGLLVLRMQGLVTTMAVALLTVWLLRVASIAGIVSMPSMPTLAEAVAITLGVWELGCIAWVLTGLVGRRQLRRHYRFPVALQARIATTSNVVELRDMTLDGLSFDSAVSVAVDLELVLKTRVPDAANELHDVTLPVQVRSSTPCESGLHRVGCRIGRLDPASRDVLLEYCFVIQPMYQLTGHRWFGRRPAPTTTPARVA